MHILFKQLCGEISQYHEIYLYGAGLYAKTLFQKFKEIGWEVRIKAFIVSKETTEKQFENVSIITFEQFKASEQRGIIIIATGEQYKEEIENILLKYNYKNYISLDQFMTTSDLAWRTLSFKQYCLYLTEKYAYEKLEKNKRKETNKIVFIVNYISVRMSKIVQALIKKGYKTLILQFDNSVPYVGEQELEEAGIQITKCKEIDEIPLKVIQENPLVYYLEFPPHLYEIGMFVCKNKRQIGKVIFAPYDLYSGMGMPQLENKGYMKMEKDLLENSDGVVWRYQSRNFLSKKYGYQYKGKSVDFWDYCESCDIDERYSESDVLKLCFLPTNLATYIDCRDSQNDFACEETIWDLVELLGNKANCEVDIYAWNLLERHKGIMDEILKKNVNFKLYVHIPHKELLTRLQRYDYGICLVRYKNPIKYVEEYYDVMHITEGTAYYSVRNSLFDIISAGVPIIGRFPVKQMEFFDQFHVRVDMDYIDFDVDYLIKHKAFYKENARNARKQLLMDEHIEELIRFFSDVSE